MFSDGWQRRTIFENMRRYKLGGPAVSVSPSPQNLLVLEPLPDGL